MKILLTGATGYIGKRLLPRLVEEGHQVICCVRDKDRFNVAPSLSPYIEVIEIDLLIPSSLGQIPVDIDGAYYLVHSMSNSNEFEALEKESAINFREALNKTQVKHVVYLSGIVNEESLSKHLISRKNVAIELEKGDYALTTLCAGIIIGSGSGSFEIIRDLVEKLPVMVTPKWLNTKSQPIGVADVIQYLTKTIFHKATYGKSYDIGGPDILSYKEILDGFAKARGLKRFFIVLPLMTPRLSSYWLYFVTSTSYKLAIALVNSMKIEVICKKNNLNELLDITPMSYKEALDRAFSTIQRNEIVSSWKDSQVSGRLNFNISEFLKVPTHGCFTDQRIRQVVNIPASTEKLWKIGDKTGWFYATWLWKIRGFLDKLVGGVGLRRGRTNPDILNAGDAVDFWRVMYANKEEGRLLLFAEMKLPGEAWLEFQIKDGVLTQTATFRPKGIWGRLYWFTVLPFHHFIFRGMATNIAKP